MFKIKFYESVAFHHHTHLHTHTHTPTLSTNYVHHKVPQLVCQWMKNTQFVWEQTCICTCLNTLCVGLNSMDALYNHTCSHMLNITTLTFSNTVCLYTTYTIRSSKAFIKIEVLGHKCTHTQTCTLLPSNDFLSLL